MEPRVRTAEDAHLDAAQGASGDWALVPGLEVNLPTSHEEAVVKLMNMTDEDYATKVRALQQGRCALQ
eukprot:13951743-Alexandrium_andersonii.AAC.2